MSDEFSSKNMKLLPQKKENAIFNIKKNLPLILNTLRAYLEHQFSFINDQSKKEENKLTVLAFGKNFHFFPHKMPTKNDFFCIIIKFFFFLNIAVYVGENNNFLLNHKEIFFLLQHLVEFEPISLKFRYDKF